MNSGVQHQKVVGSQLLAVRICIISEVLEPGATQPQPLGSGVSLRCAAYFNDNK